ncbi:S1 RNA-binding domain-containing protein [Halarchaeum sp. CBA1220]|uniref:OB-fold nucleic acid binding domain-containing protein n=1 Tax=Halarchaeum sp. CBA1220 TaxID=1853682 RepID=UPI000F3A9A32|nr:OB-fold nucleic acid binding domain-containing protein [Halarchaeum sp. CBA1220]QLC32698.1 S1 RNA-binding domain-containing protein [Halarchaeum sp. CBA1220]
MGSCIICGVSTDGHICETHEEDAVFEFRGSKPEQLTSGRYYEGSVDGFAEFGVFVDLGENVTGLLHKSEIPQRLDALDWEPGDTVYVQVDDVHGNGNVDLSWSIRQAEREFRGMLIDDPDAPTNAELPDDESEAPPGATDSAEPETETADEPAAEPEESESEEPEPDVADEAGADSADEPAVESEPEEPEAEEPETETEAEEASEGADADVARVQIDALDEHVGDDVALEAEVTGVRQTSGPTVFELTDETGTVDAAAFVEAGVRAYPEVEAGDVVHLVGEVERHHGELQVETDALDVLTGAEAQAVQDRLEAQVTERASPDDETLLVQDAEIDVVHDDLVAAATEIRRAVIESRPVIVRHTADVEGYVGGSAIERAVLPLVREEHTASDAEYHYVDRRPLDDGFYTLDDATKDVTSMLEAADRHDEKHPLFVLVGSGSTRESVDGLGLLDIYDAPTVALDGGYADGEAADAADVLVSPTQHGETPVSTGVLAAHLAGMVNADVRADIGHLPAIPFWGETPAVYADLAAEAGYEAETVADVRDALALEAFYQAYEDKREIVADLLWDEADTSLVGHIGSQFREKLETEFETAEPHLEARDAGAATVEVLDVDSYTHRYDFPPVDLLLDALYRERADGEYVLVGADSDELRVRSTGDVDVRAVGETVKAELPEAGVVPRGAQDGRVEFLSGERDAVVEAAVDAIVAQLE